MNQKIFGSHSLNDSGLGLGLRAVSREEWSPYVGKAGRQTSKGGQAGQHEACMDAWMDV